MKGINTLKSYEITQIKSSDHIGTLLYYEKEKNIIIELSNDLNEWTAPLLFAGFVKRGIYTIPRDIARVWVGERVIPHERQNIADILTRYRLKEYDEMKLLELSEGRCAQDDLMIQKCDRLPEYVLERMKTNLTDCVILDHDRALCFFADDTVKMVPLCDFEQLDLIRKETQMIETARLGSGGYYLTFNDSIDIPVKTLYEAGEAIPLCRDDFIAFITKNTLDTTQSCRLLNCSRQNLSYLIKHKQLKASKSDVNGNLYLKGDVLKTMW